MDYIFLNSDLDYLLQSRIPDSIQVCAYIVLFIFIFVTLFVFKSVKVKIRNTAFGLLMYYSFLILSNTLIFRDVNFDSAIKLIPFWSYWEVYKTGSTFLIFEIILNVVVFIPLGFLLPLCFRQINLCNTIIVTFLFSLIIEVMQLIFRRGWFEFDDVINNTLGGIIGYWMYLWLQKGVKFRRNS